MPPQMSRDPPFEPGADNQDVYRDRGFGGRSALGRAPALVVVDCSVGFTDPVSPLACDADGVLAATATLLVACRARRRPVIFTTVAYRDADLAIAAAFIEKVPHLATLRVGGSWVRIDDRVAPAPDEPVLTKLYASAFFGTGLAAMLASTACDSLVVTGLSTSGCVRATVVDGVQHGLRVVVPAWRSAIVPPVPTSRR